jgi:hypothetical protein
MVDSDCDCDLMSDLGWDRDFKKYSELGILIGEIRCDFPTTTGIGDFILNVLNLLLSNPNLDVIGISLPVVVGNHFLGDLKGDLIFGNFIYDFIFGNFIGELIKKLFIFLFESIY